MGGFSLQFPSLDNAMSAFEGFGTPGTIATRQNNPGNLQYGDFAIAHGATGVGTNGIANFPDPATGFQAQDALVSMYASQGLSLQEMLQKYAPPNAPGNTPATTSNYVNYVSNATGVAPNAPLSSAAGTGAGQPMSQWDVAKNAILTGLGPIGALAGKTPNSTGGTSLLDLTSGFSWGRAGAFFLGLIMIAGGIYLFKPVQEVVNGTARKAAKLAV